jgi:hypothetical protein
VGYATIVAPFLAKLEYTVDASSYLPAFIIVDFFESAIVED